ncbi:MAG TPA: Wzz/FepE/Etk N-terminal domain-containing protein, partial [bacterium]|nr:Wzz/FepE/Etk N-terminal domain-containing protein [bacterium]
MTEPHVETRKNGVPADFVRTVMIPVFRARWRWIVFVPFCVAVLTAIYSLIINEEYQSEAKLIVVPPKYREQQSLLPEQFSMKTYSELFNSPDLVQDLLDRLRLSSRAIQAIRKSYPDLDWAHQKKNRDFVAEGFKKADSLTVEEMLRITGCSMDEALFLTGGRSAAGERTYQGLTATDWIGADLFDERELQETKLEEFAKTISVKLVVEEDTPYGTTYAPVLTISTKANSAKGVKLKTGILADLFLERARLVTAENTKEAVESVSSAFVQAATDAWGAGNAIREYKANNPIELVQKQLDSLNQVLLGGSEQYRDPTTNELVYQPSALAELKQLERLIEKKRKSLDQLAHELDELRKPTGEWVGAMRTYLNPDEALQSLAGDIESASRQGKFLLLGVLRSKEGVWRALASLEEFEERTGYEMELSRLTDELINLNTLRKGVVQSQSELKAWEQRLASEESIREGMKSVVELKGQIPLEAITPLLNKVDSSKDVETLGKLTYEQEVFSPEYEELGAKLVNSTGQRAYFKAMNEAQQAALAAKEQEVMELQKKLTLWREQKSILTHAVEEARKAHNQQYIEFIETQTLHQNTEK